MNMIDRESLERANAAVKSQVAQFEQRLANAPLMRALFQGLQQSMSAVTAEVLAKPNAQVLESTLRLEQQLGEFPEQMAEAQQRLDAVLTAAKLRTQALRRWLESLS